MPRNPDVYEYAKCSAATERAAPKVALPTEGKVD